VSTEIYEYGTTASGDTVKKGRYAVDPSGHVVLVPMTRPIKAGWRLATQDDIAACDPGAQFAPTPIDSEPAIEVSGEPVEADVESLSIDAPYADPRD